ncbi:MAG: hypothetical protein LLG09_06980 [Negativicutes bacterium]|nr:hypothetical protein [Negativicutes bacterium]
MKKKDLILTGLQGIKREYSEGKSFPNQQGRQNVFIKKAKKKDGIPQDEKQANRDKRVRRTDNKKGTKQKEKTEGACFSVASGIK